MYQKKIYYVDETMVYGRIYDGIIIIIVIIIIIFCYYRYYYFYLTPHSLII